MSDNCSYVMISWKLVKLNWFQANLKPLTMIRYHILFPMLGVNGNVTQLRGYLIEPSLKRIITPCIIIMH